MPLPDEEDRRPLTKGGDPETTQTDADLKSGTSLTGSPTVPGLTREQISLIHNWIADANGVPADRLGFIALVETPNGNYRRRAYLSLQSAHEAMDRAEKRGLDSRIVLCELRPVVQ
jgi:hypothetical protein